MLAPFPLPLWSLPPHQELSHSADIILTWFKTQLAGKGTFIVPSGDELGHPRTEALKGMHSEDTYKTFLLPPGEPPGPSLHQDPDPYNHCVLSHSPGDDGYRWEGGTLLETQEPLESVGCDCYEGRTH